MATIKRKKPTNSGRPYGRKVKRRSASSKTAREASVGVPERGRQILSEIGSKLSAEPGSEYVAIDVDSRAHFLGETPVSTLKAAKEANPAGRYYLVRIGHAAIFRAHAR
jgi:hypothetical protein